THCQAPVADLKPGPGSRSRGLLQGEEVQEKRVDPVRCLQLHPVARSFETLIAPRTGHMLRRPGHLGLGQREVAAAPDAQRWGLYWGQGGWRADEGLRVHDGPEVVEPGGQ